MTPYTLIPCAVGLLGMVALGFRPWVPLAGLAALYASLFICAACG